MIMEQDSKLLRWLREQDKKPALLMRMFYTSMLVASVVVYPLSCATLWVLLKVKRKS